MLMTPRMIGPTKFLCEIHKTPWPSLFRRKGAAKVRTEWNSVNMFWYNKNRFCFLPETSCAIMYPSLINTWVRNVQAICIILEANYGRSDLSPRQPDQEPSYNAVCSLSSQVFEPGPKRRSINSRAFPEQGEVCCFETSLECSWLQ